LVSINAVALHSARLVLELDDCLRAGKRVSLRNQPPRPTQPSIPPVGKWVPAIAGKAKACMAHSDCGWTCGCAGKTARSLENTERFWGDDSRRGALSFTFTFTWLLYMLALWPWPLPEMRSRLHAQGIFALTLQFQWLSVHFCLSPNGAGLCSGQMYWRHRRVIMALW